MKKRTKRASFLILDRSVGAYEAKTHLSELLAEVERSGATITITKNDRPVARLVPIGTANEGRVAALTERVRKIRKDIRLDGLTIRQLIDEGRRF